LALAGFAAGVTWIDAVASQAVAILALAATLARLPQGVVGLTLLAWGNSLGDYFGNSALARAGAGSTAITACFAGPLFNVLISMALGFSARFAKLARQQQQAAAAAGGGEAGAAAPGTPPLPRTDSVPVQLTPEVALGCGCLVLYSATAVAVGRACGGRLPPWFATVARLFYLAYFCGAVAWGLSSSSASKAEGPVAALPGLFL
jgi:sodium/potassium/calcium exchanger 6